MAEQDRAENQTTELSLEELNSATGGTTKTPPKPTSGTKGAFEIEDYSFDIEQTLTIR